MSLAAFSEQQPADPPDEGSIDPTTVPKLFHTLCKRQVSGVLTLTDRGIDRSAALERGTVRFASSNDRDDRFNHVLLQAGVISLHALMTVLEESLASRDRLGEVIVRRNLISAAEVEKWIKVQVRRILHRMFNTTEGRFSFAERPVPGEPCTLDLDGDAMVIEGVRNINSWARVYKEIGGLNTEYLATREMSRTSSGLPLEPEERQLLDMCANPTSLGEMCQASPLLDLQVCKIVWAFLIIGALMKS